MPVACSRATFGIWASSEATWQAPLAGEPDVDVAAEEAEHVDGEFEGAMHADQVDGDAGVGLGRGRGGRRGARRGRRRGRAEREAGTLDAEDHRDEHLAVGEPEAAEADGRTLQGERAEGDRAAAGLLPHRPGGHGEREGLSAVVRQGGRASRPAADPSRNQVDGDGAAAGEQAERVARVLVLEEVPVGDRRRVRPEAGDEQRDTDQDRGTGRGIHRQVADRPGDRERARG